MRLRPSHRGGADLSGPIDEKKEWLYRLLAALIVFGLLSALLGQGGIWWVVSWIALAIPLILIIVCVARRRRVSA